MSTAPARPPSRASDERGFTLIELLVVVVIIGILIAIAIPLYLNYRRGANDRAAQSDLRNAVSVIEVCNTDTGSYPATAQTATTGGYTPCTNQSVKLSTGTQLSYGTTTSGWKAVTNNTAGGGKFFCYNSGTGGSVRAMASSVTTMALALDGC